MDIIRWAKTLRRKKLFNCLILAVAQSLALGSAFLALAVAIDFIFGLPALARDAARWACLALFFLGGLKIFSKELPRLALVKILGELEKRLGLTHDPLINALNFFLKSAAFSSPEQFSFSGLLMRREIERAAAIIGRRASEISRLFSWNQLLRQGGAKSAAAIFSSAFLIAGLGFVSGAGTGRLVSRIVNPYRELMRFTKNIELDPPPGIYRRLRGSMFSISLRLQGSAPRSWGEPWMWIDGERQGMMSVDESRNQRVYIYTVAGIEDSMRLMLKWGEFETGPWVFEPAPPPLIKHLRVEVQPPAYTGLAVQRQDDPVFLQAFRGSIMRMSVEFDREIGRMEVFFENDEGLRRRIGEYSPKSNFSFSYQPDLSGRIRFSLKDLNGVENQQAWVYNLDLLDDQKPEISIVEPVFSDILMDLNEELAVAWTAADDIRLLEARMVLKGAAGQEKRIIWDGRGPWPPLRPRSTAEREGRGQSKAEAHGLARFRPKGWSLKPGDAAQLYLECLDNNPGTLGPSGTPVGTRSSAEGAKQEEYSKSREILTVRIRDFQKEHRENLDKKGAALKEDFVTHIEKGVEVLGQLAQVSTQTFVETIKNLAAYDAQSGDLTNRLRNYADELSKDPLASPRWSRGMGRLASAMQEARESYLNGAKSALSSGHAEESRQQMSRYMEELEKSASAFDELKKEEKMTDALSSASRLEEMSQRLADSLADPKDAKELQEILGELEQEFQRLQEALSKLSPEEFPQEFINQIQPEDLALNQAGAAGQQLAEALRKGDMKAALEAARQMTESLKKMRQELEEAAQAHQAKPSSFFGSDEARDEHKESLIKDLGDIRKGQEQILWKTSAVERSSAALALGRLGADDQEALKKLSIEQKDLSGKTRQVLQKLSEIDREYPSLVLGSKVTKLDGALKDQSAAGQALASFETKAGLEAESSALKKLEDVENELNELAEQMKASQNQAMGQGPGARHKPIIFLPSGPGFGQEGEGSAGLRFGQVPIPRPDDYRVPSQGRQEILKSLQERRPKGLEEEVGEYLKNLLK
ncbi:MAG: hypothetical protein HY747_09100 [Elusimicrobia bacterium]|nr:hypothetical protein [Elusimicrobiota bacterium]